MTTTLVRRIRLLTAATITYNVVEAVVALASGAAAGSVALIGFGLDSVVEITSAAAVAWQFAGPDPERRERRALRIVAGSFFALAAVVTLDAVRTLVTGDEPERSTVGIVLVAISVLVMPLLSWAQRRAGRALGSASAVADSRQTLLCTYLSAAVLVGLVLNGTLGWWWADPLAALGLAVVAVREGRGALRGDVCCPPVVGSREARGEKCCPPVVEDRAASRGDACCAPVVGDGAPRHGEASCPTIVPDACTLPVAEQPLRIAEFDALFAATTAPAHRPAPTELLLRLPAGLAATARDLAARETACCSFFAFDVAVSARATELQIRVPESQTAVLDAIQRRADAAAHRT